MASCGYIKEDQDCIARGYVVMSEGGIYAWIGSHNEFDNKFG
jgi:hypothetical protein